MRGDKRKHVKMSFTYQYEYLLHKYVVMTILHECIAHFVTGGWVEREGLEVLCKVLKHSVFTWCMSLSFLFYSYVPLGQECYCRSDISYQKHWLSKIRLFFYSELVSRFSLWFQRHSSV